MKQVNFRRLAVKNFLSVGDTPVIIDFQEGINLIVGVNKDKPDRQNGAGKSVIADALYFAIFGETIREIKKDLIPNNVTGGTTQIELDFEIVTPNQQDNFKLIRTIHPSKVLILKNGEDITRDSIANTNKYVCDIISASPQVFQNCVLMTINNTTPFMAKNKVEKRKFIEDIFGLEVFSQMISSLKQTHNTIKRDFDIQSTKVDEAERSYNQYATQKEKATVAKIEKHELYCKRLEENKINIAKLQLELDSLPVFDMADIAEKKSKLTNNTEECDDKIELFVSEISTRKATISHLANQQKQMGTKNDVCPVCLKPVTQHDLAYIEEERNKIQYSINNFHKEVDEFNNKLNIAKQIKQKISTKLKEYDKTVSQYKITEARKKEIMKSIEQINGWQITLVKDIESIQDSGDEFDKIVDESLNRLNSYKEDALKLQKEISKLDIIKFVVSEEGVKSFIVNKMLDLLNSILVGYLKRLDSNSVCVFNEYFEEEITNDKGKVCSYFSFSSAERKSIDLACLFTFSDIRRMQGGVRYNISIYDELFDSSFDGKGLELITDILKERIEKYNEGIYIISHRREALQSLASNVICMEKENGITKRVM